MASATSLELSALQPSVTAAASASSVRPAIDWSMDWRVLTRTGSVVVWAWLVGYLGLSVLWVIGVSLLLVFYIVRQRKHVQFHQTLKFQKVATQHADSNGAPRRTPRPTHPSPPTPALTLTYVSPLCS